MKQLLLNNRFHYKMSESFGLSESKLTHFCVILGFGPIMAKSPYFQEQDDFLQNLDSLYSGLTQLSRALLLLVIHFSTASAACSLNIKKMCHSSALYLLILPMPV